MSIYQKSYLGFDHMSANSRTSKSIKNSLFALVFYFINLILQFFSRKIFLDYLGAEVLGLNTTATKILQKSGIQKNEVIELIYRGFI